MAAEPTTVVGGRSWATDLLGERDQSSSWPLPGPEGRDWQLATVTDVFAETPDVVTLRMRRNSSERFLAGQHFHIEVPTGTRFPALESYSVASSPWPDPATVDFTIKEVPGGRASPVLVRRIPVSATVRIEGPFGYLTWDEADGGPLALIAAGSGIVPLMAVIRYATAKELRVPMRLLYSSKDLLHTIFGRELSRLAQQNPRLEVIHTFTVDRYDAAAAHHRRVDAEMIADTFAAIAPDCLAYLCGPPGMVRTAEAALEQLGLDQSRLMSEEWD